MKIIIKNEAPNLLTVDWKEQELELTVSGKIGPPQTPVLKTSLAILEDINGKPMRHLAKAAWDMGFRNFSTLGFGRGYRIYETLEEIDKMSLPSSSLPLQEQLRLLKIWLFGQPIDATVFLSEASYQPSTIADLELGFTIKRIPTPELIMFLAKNSSLQTCLVRAQNVEHATRIVQDSGLFNKEPMIIYPQYEKEIEVLSQVLPIINKV